MSVLMPVRQLFESLADGPLPGWDVLEKTAQTLTLNPGDFLFRADQLNPYVYCVKTGLLKLVYETEQGVEWIKAFMPEGDFFASVSGLEPEGRTSFAALAMEPTEVDKLDYPAIVGLAETHPAWQKVLRLAFQRYGARKEARERELLTLSAAERYRLFIERQPVLFKRIPQADLARYLGVTPVGLSRIKHRVFESSNQRSPSR